MSTPDRLEGVAQPGRRSLVKTLLMTPIVVATALAANHFGRSTSADGPTSDQGMPDQGAPGKGGFVPKVPKVDQPGDIGRVPFEHGKYQTFPRSVDQRPHLLIDLGTLGPDVDTIFGIDFPGDIPTGAKVVFRPSGPVTETRVVGIKRTDVETVQFQPAIGGDRFDVFRLSEHGGDAVLDAMARLHAQNTARLHQKVIYVGDLGLFERQWGVNERPFLNAIIRAQRPGVPSIGIGEPDFVSPRSFQ